jgi:hypothetical protein
MSVLWTRIGDDFTAQGCMLAYRPTGYRLVVLTSLRTGPIGNRHSPIGN